MDHEPDIDDIRWIALEDTQPISVVVEVYRDDCGWWERYVNGEQQPELPSK